MGSLIRPASKLGWLATLAAAGALAWGLRKLLADDPGLRRTLVGLPEDDEPFTEEDVVAVRAAQERVRRGEFVSLDEAVPEAAALP